MQRRDVIRLGLAGLLTVGAASAARAERRIVHSPGDGFLNLRSGPGTRFAVIRRMPHGTGVEILEWAGAWVRVRHDSGSSGWAAIRYLRLPVSPYFRVAWTSDGFLNLRSGPGTRFAILRPMFTGEWVQVLERSGNWVRVRHDASGEIGWAHGRYLTR